MLEYSNKKSAVSVFAQKPVLEKALAKCGHNTLQTVGATAITAELEGETFRPPAR